MQRPLHRTLIPWLLLLAWAGIMVCPGAEPAKEGVSMDSVDNMLASWLRMFGALVTVLAIFFMGVYLFKKYGLLLQGKAAQGHLKVLESRALNQKNAVYVLDYRGEQFLVATGQQGTPGVMPLRGDLSGDFETSKPSAGSHEEDFAGEIRKAIHASS